MKSLARPADKAEILRRLSGLRPESVRRWGRMSPHQAVCHLSDTFLTVLGQRDVSHVGGPLQQRLLKWWALYLPLPWPAGIPTRPELDQACGGSAPSEFTKDVAQLQVLLETITAPGPDVQWQRHPNMGPMSHAQWLRWAYLHMDHHLRQFGH
jgi:Protein of unknown function (DUF1569)